MSPINFTLFWPALTWTKNSYFNRVQSKFNTKTLSLKIVLSVWICLWYANTHIVYIAGFYFIPGALSIDEQCYWIRESLNTFPQPPNRTNLTAIYGSISDLLIAAKKQKVLVELDSPDGQETKELNNSIENTQPRNFKFVEHSTLERGGVCKSIGATTLVRKLRWSTLGLQFDWSKVCQILLPFQC